VSSGQRLNRGFDDEYLVVVQGDDSKSAAAAAAAAALRSSQHGTPLVDVRPTARRNAAAVAPSADADTLRQVRAAVAKAATDDVLSRLLAVFDPHAHYEGSDVLALVRATLPRAPARAAAAGGCGGRGVPVGAV